MRPDIDNLLEKYWEGETSVEDEKVLKQYFKSSNVEQEHEAFKDLFVFFDNESQITYPIESQSVETKTKTAQTRKSHGPTEKAKGRKKDKQDCAKRNRNYMFVSRSLRNHYRRSQP